VIVAENDFVPGEGFDRVDSIFLVSGKRLDVIDVGGRCPFSRDVAPFVFPQYPK
jgi:hypothetical protein